MSKIRLHWLWIVIVAEILAIIGLVVWAITIRQPNEPTAKRPTTAEPKHNQSAYNTPAVDLLQVATGLSFPVAIASMSDQNDKRLFVVEQTGFIRIVTAEKTVDPKPFLDIKSKVQAGGEMGLLGMAFHPKVTQNNYFFINYTDTASNTIVARYTISKKTGRADTNSEKIVLKIKQPYSNHNGGGLAFGKDGYLYIGMGDGGSGGDPQNHAQNADDLLGKMLRIDVDKGVAYDIPADNPFVKGGAKPEIWAMGFRNPWRYSFDSKTGDLYIADVGQGNYEEIDFQPHNSKGGENYGWRCFEGAQIFETVLGREGCRDPSAYVKPILQYDHGDGRCSITGGHVYRGKTYPALDGKYFYGDYCNGQIFFAEKTNSTWNATLAKDTDMQISTFGENSVQELFLADYVSGIIFQITDTANGAQ